MIESGDRLDIFDKIVLGVDSVENIREYLPPHFYVCMQNTKNGPIFYTQGENNEKTPLLTYGEIECFEDSRDFINLVDFLINHKSCTAVICGNSLYHNLISNTSVEYRQNKEKNKAIAVVGDRVVELYRINI